MLSNSGLYYRRFGYGNKVLLAIHGFGDRSEMFLKLKEVLEEEYTVIAIDLPFHGQTNWQEKEFYPIDIEKAVVDILREENIEDKITVMGHSMGARIILGFSDQLFDRIETCILLAPAGFQGAKSDSKFLFPKFFRKLLKTITSNSKLIVKIFKFGKQLGIINNGTYKFLELQTVIPERRNRLFDCWISLYNFPINLNKFKSYILHKNIRLVFYYGTTDYITPVKYARRFIKELPDSNIIMVEDGHYLVREKLAEVLKNDLLKSLP